MFFTCVVRLTHMFHVWAPRRRLYDCSALHIVGGNYTPFPPVPSIALVSLRSLRLNGCRLGSVLISTVWGLHSVPTYISTRCSTHIPCHNMRLTGWDPLCSLPDAPFLSSSAWGRYHTSRPDPGFPVSRPDFWGFLQEKLCLRLSLVLFLCCNRHISLDSFRHALHTKENFSPVHFGCVLLAKNRHYSYELQGVTMGQRAMIYVFVSTSSTNFTGAFVPVSHSCSLHSSTIKTKWNERFYFYFITNSNCMHIFCVP